MSRYLFPLLAASCLSGCSAGDWFDDVVLAKLRPAPSEESGLVVVTPKPEPAPSVRGSVSVVRNKQSHALLSVEDPAISAEIDKVLARANTRVPASQLALDFEVPSTFARSVTQNSYEVNRPVVTQMARIEMKPLPSELSRTTAVTASRDGRNGASSAQKLPESARQLAAAETLSVVAPRPIVISSDMRKAETDQSYLFASLEGDLDFGKARLSYE